MSKRTYIALSVPIFLASCGAEPTSPEDLTLASAIKPAAPGARPMPVISDGRTDGSPAFYFLFPIVAERAPDAQPFDQEAAPTVTICRFVSGACAETVTEFPYSDRPAASLSTVRQWSSLEFYLATWVSPRTGAGQRYRATVKARGIALGFADIQLVRRLLDLRSVPKDVVGVVAGWPLPIPFRIERGAGLPLPILFLHEINTSDEDIYSVLPDGSTLTRITNSPGRDYAPRWSPDRTRIAFSSERWCGGCGIAPELYVANADGSGAVQLTQGMYAVYGTTWSPDGARLAIESSGGTYLPSNLRIYVMNADGTGVLGLTAPRSFKPDWSPDGSRILFETYAPAGISVMFADGSGMQQIRALAGDNLGASWSPDGKKIAFGDWNGSEADIWIMNANGSGATRLTSGAANDGGPVWSPDGQHLAFHSDRSGRFQVYTMRSDGTDLRQVTFVTEGRAVYPAWR